MTTKRTTRLAGITLASAVLLVSLAYVRTADAQDMSAGGLSPPPPMAPSASQAPAASETSQDLDDAKKGDSGRGLEWVYLEAEGGFQHVGLRTFNIDEQSFSAGFIETQANGPVIGAGLGLRLVFITIGARGRVGFFNTWDLFSVGGEIGLHLPLGNLEPHFELGGGYTALGSFKSALQSGAAATALENTQVHGFYVRGQAGLDYYITPMFTLGVSASAEVLGLTRPGLDPSKVTEIQGDPNLTTLERARAEVLKVEGSSYGAAVTGSAVLGLHF
ncbi:hypothetical protein [Polyangium sorediatum]|uniref:Outer membrane protein beta-barrel domain-containing protein n=1 Tax=Polyangium sorediatum TaxID=889274 RepID=A0ABT6NW46_9BACT|nr:hypothetical protein [Polyangium sorediatum]MDI1432562.1 hypothetical protein [Polyangium sorediatum]